MGKIPKIAKRVFNGEVFDIYQWKQKMFDGTYRTFERAKTLEGAAIIATVGNKIVVLRQKQPGTDWYYSLPGGYLDHPKEPPEKGAMRELFEETGLRPEKVKYWKKFRSSGRVDADLHVYVAQNCRKTAEPSWDRGGEKIEMKLVSFEQFLKYTDKPDFKNQAIIIELQKARIHPKMKRELFKLIYD